MMVFVRCTDKVRHQFGHAIEVARHAWRSVFVLWAEPERRSD